MGTAYLEKSDVRESMFPSSLLFHTHAFHYIILRVSSTPYFKLPSDNNESMQSLACVYNYPILSCLLKVETVVLLGAGFSFVD